MVLLIIIVCAAIGYAMGEAKDGVGGIGGMFIGGLLGPIGLLILLFMGKKETK
jgi:1,4-dihydroxy-2-naphthoate octaprenyltransferase